MKTKFKVGDRIKFKLESLVDINFSHGVITEVFSLKIALGVYYRIKFDKPTEDCYVATLFHEDNFVLEEDEGLYSDKLQISKEEFNELTKI